VSGRDLGVSVRQRLLNRSRSENRPFQELLQIVEDDYASHNKRSIASLRSRLKRLRAELEDVRAVDLDKDRITKYRDGLELAPASVNRDLEVPSEGVAFG